MNTEIKVKRVLQIMDDLKLTCRKLRKESQGKALIGSVMIEGVLVSAIFSIRPSGEFKLIYHLEIDSTTSDPNNIVKAAQKIKELLKISPTFDVTETHEVVQVLAKLSSVTNENQVLN